MYCNLWAPFAFSFEEPVALSKSCESDSGVTRVSFTERPILYDGVFVYLSRIILCFATLTKVPLIKYTPVSILADEPVAVALDAWRVAELELAEIVVEPYVIAVSDEIFSPSTNVVVTPAVAPPAVLVAVCVYLT